MWGTVSRFSLSRGTSGALRPFSRLCASRCHRLWPLSHSAPRDTIPIKMSWRDGAAAQYNRVLSIMRDTMDKTLFVRRRTRHLAHSLKRRKHDGF